MKIYILTPNLKRILCLILFQLLTGNTEHLTINESTFWLKKIKANIDFSGGLITIKASDSSNNINGFIEFNPELFQPNLKFTSISRTGILDLSTNFEFDLNLGKQNNDYGNKAEILLPTSIPINFNLDYSLSTIEMDLDKIEVSSFNFDLGLGSAILDFGNKLQSDCNYITVDVGMGSATIKNIGNLECDETKIECGMGSMLLDFSGEIYKNRDYDISVGMGSVEIQIPNDVNVLFKTDQSLLSNLELENMDLIKTNVYRNEKFDKDKPTLIFNCSIGLGSITLNWIK